MKRVCGIWLPDDDDHFEHHLNSNVIDGFGTYQYNKIIASLDAIPLNRRSFALDIGAHVGLWSRFLCEHFRTVYAYEPVQENYECLIQNTNDCPNVQLFKYGVSSEPGSLVFGKCPGNTGNAGVSETGEMVECVMIDSLNLKHVDFIKIDVEGWELSVLKGAVETITRCKPYMLIEQKPGNAEKYGISRFAALEYLQGMGMTVYWQKSGDYFLRWE